MALSSKSLFASRTAVRVQVNRRSLPGLQTIELQQH